MRRAIALMTSGPLLLGLGAVPAEGATHSIGITPGFAYRPEGLRVTPGDTVVWDAGESHPLAFDAGGGRFTTPQERVLGEAGPVRFYCTEHGGPGGLGMSGLVTVGDGNAAPTVAIRRETAEPRAGEPVLLVARAVDPERIALSIAWDIDGDGTFERTDAGATTSGVYGAGTHTVHVRATDDLGLTAIASDSFTVAARPGQPEAPPPEGGVPGRPEAPPPEGVLPGRPEAAPPEGGVPGRPATPPPEGGVPGRPDGAGGVPMHRRRPAGYRGGGKRRRRPAVAAR